MKKFILVILLTVFGTALYAQHATNKNVTALYIATFDRAPDAEGLNYWVDISGLTLEDIALSFFDQAETQEKYPTNYTNYQFIFAIYGNLFERHPDDAGLVYWETELNRNVIDRSFFILAVVNGAIGDDANILSNKTEVGAKFVESAIDDMEMAKDIISNVTADYSTVRVAIDKLDVDSQQPISGNTNELGEVVIIAHISSSTMNWNDREVDVTLYAEDSYSIRGDIIKYIWKDINGNILSTNNYIEFKGGGNPNLRGDTILPDCEGYVELTIYDSHGYSDKDDTLLNRYNNECI